MSHYELQRTSVPLSVGLDIIGTPKWVSAPLWLTFLFFKFFWSWAVKRVPFFLRVVQFCLEQTDSPTQVGFIVNLQHISLPWTQLQFVGPHWAYWCHQRNGSQCPPGSVDTGRQKILSTLYISSSNFISILQDMKIHHWTSCARYALGWKRKKENSHSVLILRITVFMQLFIEMAITWISP